MVTYQQIIDYCRDYQEDLNRAISDPTNIESLGINFERLTREEARGLAVGLSYTLIHGQMNMVVTQDHRKFWDAVGKHLLEPPSLYFGESFESGEPFPSEISYLRKLFITVIKTETTEWEIFESHKITGWKWPTCEPGYPANAVRPGEYFIYPLLEAVLKRTLSNYVEIDGKVTIKFTINFSNGNSKTYNSGEIISSISHLLLLLFQHGENKELIDEIKFLFKKIKTAYPERSALDVISNEWRNSALHGDKPTTTASSILLNIVLLIAIASVSEKEWEERYTA